MSYHILEWVDSCESTNALMKQRAESLPGGYVIAAREQTAGRGRRGNSWEAAPGENLTFSMLLRPSGMPAGRQFELSMLVALAVADVVERNLGPDVPVEVKWPNDIYVGDRKVAGILMECSLAGANLDYA
ncbi:MAG: biotin--[acetyl-CoA-carboxylase] ligase, partial [Muribaculaceae bacterium]|nr:biotin--[acetyl-CoA-carboxylase] ligase [Muribaculaceae bacterium]